MNGTFIDLDLASYIILIIGTMVALYWLVEGD